MDGYVASLIVIGYRLLVPVSILFWPLGGFFASMLADASDAMVLERTGWGLFGGNRYQFWDKGLDLWFLAFALIATRMYWTSPLARKIALVLFVWRALGVIVHLFWPHDVVYVLAPNIFEFFFIVWTVIEMWWPGFKLAGTNLYILLVAVTVPKIIQEYLMHFRYVDQTWNFFRTHLFWWLY